MLNHKQLHHFWTAARVVGSCARRNVPPGADGVRPDRHRTDQRKPVQAPGPRPGADRDRAHGAGLRRGDLPPRQRNRELQSPRDGARGAFQAGIADVVPKTIAWCCWHPRWISPKPMRIVCWEGKIRRPARRTRDPQARRGARRQPVAVCHGRARFQPRARRIDHRLLRRPRRRPPCLATSPPGPTAHHRRCCGVEASVRAAADAGSRPPAAPRIVGEFDDSALMRAFAEAGAASSRALRWSASNLPPGGGIWGRAKGVTETHAISVSAD